MQQQLKVDAIHEAGDQLADLSPADVHRFRADLGKAHGLGEELKDRQPCSRAMTTKVMASLSSILSDMVAQGQAARAAQVPEALTERLQVNRRL